MIFTDCFPSPSPSPRGPATSIPVELGYTAGHDRVRLDLAAEGHTIISGKTRSGKTVLTYNALVQLGQFQAVRVIGSDKTGILLKPFADRVHEPRICLSATDIAAHVAVLDWAVAEMNRRNTDLQAAGRDKWEVFSSAFPLVIVVIEEFPGLIRAAELDDAATARKPADRLAPKIRLAIETLAAESAKAGIRLMLIAQRADAAVVGGPTRSNFSVRVTHRLDEPEGVKMLHPGLEPEDAKAAQSFGPGVGFIETARDGLRKFKGDYLDYQTYRATINGLHPARCVR